MGLPYSFIKPTNVLGFALTNTTMCIFPFRLERLSDEDFRKAEQFVRVMKILYTSTVCISAERSPTLGQILPILGKLQHHFAVTDDDSSFTQAIKEKIWGDLSKRYQVCCIFFSLGLLYSDIMTTNIHFCFCFAG